ncbi:MAG TPA: hypothetical protein VHM91_22260, partial [Verrucomicrobiales bacterium]|nr:hypothetical protein [Verrucomicrobiales bacterium]
CAACDNPVLMENGNRKHPYAKRIPGLSHRARVAWDVLLKPSYQCMYCSTRCRSKKTWESGAAHPGNPGAPLFSHQAKHTPSETFPESVFGGILGEEGKVDGTFRAPEDLPVAENQAVVERVVTPSFSAATVFPGARTLPVAVIPPPGPPSPPVSFPPSPAEPLQKEIIDEPAAPPASPPGAPSAEPLPWAVPTPTVSTPAIVPNMNRSSHDHPGANPFLAAAAAMPPPPSPALPPIPSAVARAQTVPTPPFHQEFPFTASPAPASEGPPPWTLPSPSASEATVSPVTAPVRLPAAITAPVLLRSAAAHGAPQNQPHSVDLLKDVIQSLEEGHRAMTDAFQSLIGKLQSRLSTVVPAAPPPMVTAPVPVITAPVPVISHAVPEVTAPVPVFTMPVPVATAPVPDFRSLHETTAAAPAPVVPAPVPVFAPGPSSEEALRPPMPPAVPAPPPPPAEIFAPAAPRRKFARPAGMAAQQLNNTLNEVFDAPASSYPAPSPIDHHSPNGNGTYPPVSEPQP